MFYWADFIALTIQYGGRTDICDRLVGKTSDEQFNIVIDHGKNFELYEYGAYYLRDEKMA